MTSSMQVPKDSDDQSEDLAKQGAAATADPTPQYVGVGGGSPGGGRPGEDYDGRETHPGRPR